MTWIRGYLAHKRTPRVSASRIYAASSSAMKAASGLRVWGLGFRVQGVGCRAQIVGSRIWGFTV